MEVKPLSSLNSLLSWNGPGILSQFLKNLSLLSRRSSSSPLERKVEQKIPQGKNLVCHDLRGGYVDDRFCFGSSNIDAYRFYQWNCIDIFVYFSHHFVTIPPTGWIETAHKHGVKILGTVITEWDHGKEIWERLLEDQALVDLAINNLVEIAHVYHIEGWLLNVENEIHPDKIPDLVYFVDELRRRMRHRNADSVVIWYDSVTCEGKLKWQNKLNEQNRCFFDVCDGIFLNYTWDEQCLIDSVDAAGGRKEDVFVGIDVWGRNFYKGGGFNCDQALSLIRKYDLSTAIFAPGWSHEALGSDCFFSNENKLWGSMGPFLLYHGPCELPLKTSFCQGFGKNYYKDGQVYEEGPWFNLSRQQIQPLWQEFYDICSLNTDVAFNGGSSLAFWVGDVADFRLMSLGIELVPWLELKIVYKVSGVMKNLAFYLTLDRRSNELEDGVEDIMESKIWLFAEAAEEKESSKTTESTSDDVLTKSETDASTHLLPNEISVTPETRKVHGWKVQKYILPKKGGRITSFGVRAVGPAVLSFGQLSIEEMIKTVDTENTRF